MKKAIEYINSKLGKDEILSQLAEEAAEVTQAALKLRRAINGNNPTPVNTGAAWQSIKEELADIQVCRMVLFEKSTSDEDINEIAEQKLERWERRLKAKEKEDTSTDDSND